MIPSNIDLNDLERQVLATLDLPILQSRDMLRNVELSILEMDRSTALCLLRSSLSATSSTRLCTGRVLVVGVL